MISVVSVNDIGNVPPGCDWVFLGKDVLQRQHAENRLGRSSRIKLGRRVDEAARSIRDQVNHAIAAFGQQHEDEVFWWSTELSYRDDGGDLLRLSAYIVVFDELVEQYAAKSAKEDLVVAIEDLWCYQTLKEHYRNHATVTFLSNIPHQLLLLKGKYLLRGLAVRMYAVFAALFEKVYFTLFTGQKIEWEDEKIGEEAINTRGTITWVYTLIESRVFDENGHITDVYLPRLEQYATGANSKILRFSNILINRKLYPLIRRNLDSMELMIRYVSVLDIFASFVKFPRFSGDIYLMSGNLNSSHLLNREKWREIRSHGLSSGYLWFRACAHFIRRSSESRNVIFYWYENQPWEKLLCLAKRSTESDSTILVGYQHSSVPWMKLSYFPDSIEWESMPHPDWIFTNSPINQKLLVAAGYPESRTIMVGAARYAHYAAQDTWQPRERERYSPLNVYVALPYDLMVARELLTILCRNERTWMKHALHFFIRPHPIFSFNKIGIFPEHFDNLFRANDTLANSSQKMDLLLCSNTTMSLEGIVLGIPVVSYIPEGTVCLDSAVDAFPDHIYVCDSTDIVELLKSWREIRNDNENSISNQQIENAIFPPVDEKLWLDVISGRLQ